MRDPFVTHHQGDQEVPRIDAAHWDQEEERKNTRIRPCCGEDLGVVSVSDVRGRLAAFTNSHQAFQI